jgi:hypothetical protein
MRAAYNRRFRSLILRFVRDRPRGPVTLDYDALGIFSFSAPLSRLQFAAPSPWNPTSVAWREPCGAEPNVDGVSLRLAEKSGTCHLETCFLQGSIRRVVTPNSTTGSTLIL